MPRTQVIVCTHRQMKQLCDEQEAIEWVINWNKEVDESIRHPIIQEAIDYFVNKKQDPEYGLVCLRIWKKYKETHHVKKTSNS